MKTTDTAPQSVPMTDFKAHCTEYFRGLEKGSPPIQVTRHGKAIALVTLPPPDSEEPQTVADWMGSLRGTATFSSDYDPHEPAWKDDEWEMNRE